MDTYNWDTYQLAYIGDDLEKVGDDISFEYNRGFSGTGVILNDEGIANLGGSGGNGGGLILRRMFP